MVLSLECYLRNDPDMVCLQQFFGHSAVIAIYAALSALVLSDLTGAAQANKLAEPLVFESKTIEITLESGKQTADITFLFTNTSQKSVEIAALQAACSCLEAKLKDDKKIYQSGEKGEVTARFNVGSLMGTIEKQVIVKLAGEQPGAVPIILNAKITIPELLEITPRTLNWKLGAEPSTQIQRIRVTHNEPIHITGVVTTNNQFATELKTIRDGWEYEVAVTPGKTSEPGFAIIKITSDSKISRYRMVNAFALVKN